ncbi:MAG: hypothetical protein ACREF5_01420 [Candidatus Saccharimonadales bacterium]
MVNPEAGQTSSEVGDGFVGETTNPEIPSYLFGRDDPRSIDLYREMTLTMSVKPMDEFIARWEKPIIQGGIGSNKNSAMVRQLVELVAGMPTELPDHERLLIWHYILSSDWVLLCGDANDISSTINDLRENLKDNRDEGFVTSLGGLLENVVAQKKQLLKRPSDLPQQSEEPLMTDPNSEISTEVDKLVDIYNEKFLLQNSLNVLSTISHQAGL